MTPQEQKMLEDLIARVDNTRLEERDPDAAQHIEQWTARNRDASYILAQTVLVQTYALEQAKAQMQSMQQQAQQSAPQPAKATSFLGNLFGHKDEPRPPQPAAPPAYAQQPGYTPVPQYAQQGGYPPPAYNQPAYGQPQGYPQATGGGSSFLRSAATTAAGVAAGALAFEGVESLMHGFGHAAGFGGGSGLGDFGGRPEETVINNYYDSPASGQDGLRDGGFGNSGGFDADRLSHAGDSGLNPQQDLASDVNVGDDGGQLQADTDLPTLDDNDGSFDTATDTADDVSIDDGGSFGDDNFDNS